jgi:hypothetical protein
MLFRCPLRGRNPATAVQRYNISFTSEFFRDVYFDCAQTCDMKMAQCSCVDPSEYEALH